jgi:uncharacterized protein YigA (DUF484 family)
VSENLNAKLQVAPVCGKLETVKDLLEEEFIPESGSIVLIQLQQNDTNLGVLLMSSPQESKFSSSMGLVYIHQLAQLASAALYRFRDE